MSKIVAMPRWYGDVLTRMKIEYVNTGIKNGSVSIILVPDKQARFFKRFGQEFSVRDNYAPQDVFGEDLDISLVLAENLPEGFENREETVKNQNEATIDKVSDNLYLIEADFTDMVKYTSTDPNQAALGKFYWLGVVVDTGKETIIGSQFNGYTFVQADVDEATSVGAPAGSFILWLKLERGNRTFILKLGDKETAITLKIVNTAVEDVVAPYMVSATAYFEDGDPVDFVGNSLTVELGSVLTSIRATLNSSVVLNGTPDVTAEDLEDPYGSIGVDDEDSKVVIITPYGSNGTSSTAGEFVARVPADSVRHRGVGNVAVTINLIVVEAEPSEEGLVPFELGDTVTDIYFDTSIDTATLNTYLGTLSYSDGICNLLAYNDGDGETGILLVVNVDGVYQIGVNTGDEPPIVYDTDQSVWHASSATLETPLVANVINETAGWNGEWVSKTPVEE